MSQTRFSISWSVRTLSVLVLIMAVSSCGFKPLYAKKEGEGRSAGSCNNFTVNKVERFGISGQRLQYKLQDGLNRACVDRDNKYIVDIGVVKYRDAIAIQKDREVTRYNLTLVANYTVKNRATGKVIDDGTTTMTGGFDAVVSDYGTYALEEDTQIKLMEEIANELVLKLSSKILRKK